MAADRADITIIGGGAAGLTAAIFAAQSDKAPGSAGGSRRIVVLDGATTIGAKILVAGGGRCNVTHDVVTPDDFNGSRNIVRNILAAFDATAAFKWFASMGVELKREETGKLFPVTDSARTVLVALLDRCKQLGVTVQSCSKVTKIEPPESSDADFTITHAAGTLASRKIILATGGKSLPKTGSDGSGYNIASSLGHTVTPTYMALVPMVLGPEGFHAELSGIAHEAEITTLVNNKPIDRRRGSLLWTHFGISGPVVLDASRHWIIARDTGLQPEMRCNFLPGETPESAEKWLIAELAARPKAALVTVLSKKFPERLVLAVLKHSSADPAVLAGQVPRDIRRAIVATLTALPLPIAHGRGWNYAEVTAGGVPLNEIDFRTMQSRKAPGLYLIGEILDCDGRIGGYNFQWAWATGYLAGNAAAK
ncbi:aminoacetone oxidase family FAD-binding enzyme [soil metagenome]